MSMLSRLSARGWQVMVSPCNQSTELQAVITWSMVECLVVMATISGPLLVRSSLHDARTVLDSQDELQTQKNMPHISCRSESSN